MKWIKDNNKDYQWISTFPTDTPFFKKQILKDFYDKVSLQKSKLFFIKSNNTRHNIFGLWSIDLIDKLEDDLNKGNRKVEDWADSVGVEIINMKFDKKDPFFNINTKEDLEEAKVNLLND
jgi:molybdopterin-guanine dinucleotide biosynthesis protein A